MIKLIIIISIFFLVSFNQAIAEKKIKISANTVYLFSLNGEFLSYELGKNSVTNRGLLGSFPVVERLLPAYKNPRQYKNGKLFWIDQSLYHKKSNSIILLIKFVDGENSSDRNLLVSIKEGKYFSPVHSHFFDGNSSILLNSIDSSVLLSRVKLPQGLQNEGKKIFSSIEELDIPDLKLIHRIDEALLFDDFLMARKSFSTSFHKDAWISKDSKIIVDGLTILKREKNQILHERININSFLTPSIEKRLKSFYKHDPASNKNYLPFSVMTADYGKIVISSIDKSINSSFAILFDAIGKKINYIIQSPLARFQIIGSQLLEERLNIKAERLVKTGEIYIYNLLNINEKPRKIFNKILSGDELNHKFVCGSNNGYFVYLNGMEYFLVDMSNAENYQIIKISDEIFPFSDASCLFVMH